MQVSYIFGMTALHGHIPDLQVATTQLPARPPAPDLSVRQSCAHLLEPRGKGSGVGHVVDDFRRKLELARNCGAEPLADAALLKQALVNLLGNAIKFSSKIERPLIEMGSQSDPTGEKRISLNRDASKGLVRGTRAREPARSHGRDRTR
jgi:signal transduction histidine kinase